MLQYVDFFVVDQRANALNSLHSPTHCDVMLKKKKKHLNDEAQTLAIT